MNIILDYTKDIPMYEQIENGIKELIIQGKLKQNDKLPSVRILAQELSVSTITIKRAYQDLEREGITYSINGVGTFIKLLDNEGLLNGEREKLYNELRSLLDKFKNSGVKRDEIIDKIKEFMEG
ncbi:MAG: GntR family transcriptional regulator [Clostridium sp.]